jgi:two-component system, LytTR family, response regulator
MEINAGSLLSTTVYIIEGEGNYSRLYFTTGQALIHRSLNSLEDRLPTSDFIRANRSQIISLQAIKSIEPWFSQTLKALLINGHEIEFSRRASTIFRQKMSI